MTAPPLAAPAAQQRRDDICMALQTHINDIMMKRYSKAQAASGDGAGSGDPDAPAERAASIEQRVLLRQVPEGMVAQLAAEVLNQTYQMMIYMNIS